MPPTVEDLEQSNETDERSEATPDDVTVTYHDNFDLHSSDSGDQMEVMNSILNIKDKHKLTQAALDDVVHATTAVCEFIKGEVKSAIHGLAFDMNVDSTSFVAGVMGILDDRIKSP